MFYLLSSLKIHFFKGTLINLNIQDQLQRRRSSQGEMSVEVWSPHSSAALLTCLHSAWLSTQTPALHTLSAGVCSRLSGGASPVIPQPPGPLGEFCFCPCLRQPVPPCLLSALSHTCSISYLHSKETLKTFCSVS